MQQRRGSARLNEKLIIPRYDDLGAIRELPQSSIEIRYR
jgi:hypothetical protein